MSANTTPPQTPSPIRIPSVNACRAPLCTSSLAATALSANAVATSQFDFVIVFRYRYACPPNSNVPNGATCPAKACAISARLPSSTQSAAWNVATVSGIALSHVKYVCSAAWHANSAGNGTGFTLSTTTHSAIDASLHVQTANINAPSSTCRKTPLCAACARNFDTTARAFSSSVASTTFPPRKSATATTSPLNAQLPSAPSITPKTDGADTTVPAASVTSPAATSGVARTTSIATSTPGRSHNPASATAFSNARNCDISTLSIATTTASCVPTSAFNSPAPTICGTIFAPPAKSAELSLGNT